MTNANLGKLVRSYREKRSWSQSHLAKAAGLSTRTIQRLERKGTASKETLLSIAAAFDVDIQKLTALTQHQDSPEQVIQLGRKGRSFHIKLTNWFSNKKKQWQKLMTAAGTLLFIFPGGFLSVGVFKYSLDVEWYPDPFALIQSSFFASIWDLASPFLLLGSLVLAIFLNLFPFLDIHLENKSSSLSSSIRYQGGTWNWAILLTALLVLGLMCGYVISENIAEHSIQQYLH